MGNSTRPRKKSYCRPRRWLAEARGLDVGVGELEVPAQRIPLLRVLGRPADAVAAHGVAVEAAAAEVAPGLASVGAGEQPRVVPLDRGGDGLDELRPLAPALALVAVGVAQRDAVLGRQPLDRAREVELLLVAHERDDVAGLLAPEAVVETLFGVDGERR
jgi:hypothetical protein